MLSSSFFPCSEVLSPCSAMVFHKECIKRLRFAIEFVGKRRLACFQQGSKTFLTQPKFLDVRSRLSLFWFCCVFEVGLPHRQNDWNRNKLIPMTLESPKDADE
jgi:hypothetical protein